MRVDRKIEAVNFVLATRKSARLQLRKWFLIAANMGQSAGGNQYNTYAYTCTYMKHATYYDIFTKPPKTFYAYGLIYINQNIEKVVSDSLFGP